MQISISIIGLSFNVDVLARGSDDNALFQRKCGTFCVDDSSKHSVSCGWYPIISSLILCFLLKGVLNIVFTGGAVLRFMTDLHWGVLNYETFDDTILP